MARRIAIASTLLLVLAALAAPSLACVGKSLVVGTDSTPESRVVAQILAVLINERTGTTVEIEDFDSNEALFKELSGGHVDLALGYAGKALEQAGLDRPGDGAAALEQAKSTYMTMYNLVWLAPLGFEEPGVKASPAATVAQKHALKKFPALPRLIAKTADKLPAEVISTLAAADNKAQAARDFLRKNKLI